MDIATATARFEAEGYLVVDGFFDAAVMDHLDAVIGGYFGGSPEFRHDEAFLRKSQTEVVPWFPQRDGRDDFDAIENDARLLRLSEAILSPDWKALYCMVMFSPQGTAGQAWHQDCPPESPGRFNLNRLVYTRDVRDDIGGQIVVVPGSHKRGELPAGEPTGTFDDEVVLRPKKGTLLLLHGHTWHRVLPITGGSRCSINYRAVPAGTPDDITDVCVYRNMRYRFSDASMIEERVV